MIQQIRRLTQALIISGALNIALLSLFFYWMIKDKAITSAYQLKPPTLKQQQVPLADERSLEEVILAYHPMLLEQLISDLNNLQPIENGYTHRDVVLGYLVSLRHFNIAKALEGSSPLPPSQLLTTVVLNGQRRPLFIYPGMKGDQFEKITAFARTEKWPLTTQGLFELLQNEEIRKREPSLAEAFYLTSEFHLIETLFRRSGVEVERSVLLNILLEGPWEAFYAFSEHQKALQDLSPARRQFFLMDYLLKGSKTAALVLLRTDEAFVVRKLDDHALAVILHVLNTPSPEAQSFAQQLLNSPRSEHLRRMAAARLHDWGMVSIPQSISTPQLPVQVPSLKPTVIAQTEKVKPAASPPRPSKPTPQRQEIVYYVVKEGDSLWKIARQFKIDVDTLLKINHLTSDQLQPGMSLRIPLKAKG